MEIEKYSTGAIRIEEYKSVATHLNFYPRPRKALRLKLSRYL